MQQRAFDCRGSHLANVRGIADHRRICILSVADQATHRKHSVGLLCRAAQHYSSEVPHTALPLPAGQKGIFLRSISLKLLPFCCPNCPLPGSATSEAAIWHLATFVLGCSTFECRTAFAGDGSSRGQASVVAVSSISSSDDERS